MSEEQQGPKGNLKPQVYKDERPAEHFTRFHSRTRAKRPNWMYEAVRLVLTPYLLLFFRTRAIDSDKVPADGPAIVAPNHFSFLDHFFVAVYLRRKVQFMAKSQLFKPPLQTVYHNGGVFPVRRGHRDDEAFKTAHAVLARGGIVVMYCEGGRSRTGGLGEPKAGIGRLALESGAPVVPVALRPFSRRPRQRRSMREKICSEAAWDCSRVGSSTCSKRIGSLNCTVTLGNCRRFQSRTRSEPASATGTTGAPDSSASRPMPALGSPSSPVRERPPSQYMTTIPPRASTA